MAAPKRPALKDPNQDIAARILDVAEAYRPSPRYWGYKRAARTMQANEYPTIAANKAKPMIPSSARICR